MRSIGRRCLAVLVPGILLAVPVPASANHGNADNASPNMFHVGQVERTGINSDLAFWQGGPVKGPVQDLAAAGNYAGFRLLDIRDPENPKEVTTVKCNGPQGDVSFYQAENRLLLFVSVDTPQTTPGPPPGGKDCQSSNSTEPTGWEGIRIWDVTTPASPRFVTAVRTDCGSHTHTTIPDYDEQRAIIYVSSYPLAPNGIGPQCGPPPESQDPGASREPHAKISIVEVPDKAPETAHVLKEQPLHLDTLVGPEGNPESAAGTVGCHDITVLTEANQAPESNPRPRYELAAAACISEAQIWDISDPANPRTTDPSGHSHIRSDSPKQIWHSSAFTWDGEVVVFGDEHGGGSAPGCGGSGDVTGNVWFYKTVEPPAPSPLLGRYHIPRSQLLPTGPQSPLPQECTMHNFNVVPVNDNKAYIGVSSAYKGGTTVFDFSAAKNAEPHEGSTLTAPPLGREIGFYDAQCEGDCAGEPGGEADTWSTYWYNDYIWANDGLNRPTPPQPKADRGFDVFKLLLPDQNGKQLRARKFHHLNPQTQEVFTTQGG